MSKNCHLTTMTSTAKKDNGSTDKSFTDTCVLMSRNLGIANHGCSRLTFVFVISKVPPLYEEKKE